VWGENFGRAQGGERDGAESGSGSDVGSDEDGDDEGWDTDETVRGGRVEGWKGDTRLDPPQSCPLRAP